MRLLYESTVEQLANDLGMQLAIHASDDKEFMDGLAMAAVILLDQSLAADENGDFDPFDDEDDEIWPPATDDYAWEDDEDDEECLGCGEDPEDCTCGEDELEDEYQHARDQVG